VAPKPEDPLNTRGENPIRLGCYDGSPRDDRWGRDNCRESAERTLFQRNSNTVGQRTGRPPTSKKRERARLTVGSISSLGGKFHQNHSRDLQNGQTAHQAGSREIITSLKERFPGERVSGRSTRYVNISLKGREKRIMGKKRLTPRKPEISLLGVINSNRE